MRAPLEPFIATFTGGRFYPFGPDPARIDISDIAHALSQQCRYAGHTAQFWSVAAHSLEVARRVHRAGAAPPVVLSALLHDASEAYIPDMPKPIKSGFLNYEQCEENVQYAVALKFGLPFPWSWLVDQADQEIVPDEVFNFYPPGSDAWKRYGISQADVRPRLEPLMPADGERQFLRAFGELTERVLEDSRG